MGIAFKWAKEFHPATEEEASKAAKTRTSSWRSASMQSKSNLDRIANALSWICSPSNPGRPPGLPAQPLGPVPASAVAGAPLIDEHKKNLVVCWGNTELELFARAGRRIADGSDGIDVREAVLQVLSLMSGPLAQADFATRFGPGQQFLCLLTNMLFNGHPRFRLAGPT